MKTISLLTILALILASALVIADTPEEFLASYRAALEQKDAAKLFSLYYTEGCSEGDLQSMKEMLPLMAFYKGKLQEIKYEPLPKDEDIVHILNGKKYETTYAPQGKISFSYDSNDGKSQYKGGDAYAVIGNKYRLIAMKSSDLGWKGPKDQQLVFNLLGNAKDKLQVSYKWNASGVDLEKTALITPSGVGVMGQFFESIKVTSNGDDVDVDLSVIEGGKDIYTSQHLKGKGTLEYKK